MENNLEAIFRWASFIFSILSLVGVVGFYVGVYKSKIQQMSKQMLESCNEMDEMEQKLHNESKKGDLAVDGKLGKHINNFEDFKKWIYSRFDQVNNTIDNKLEICKKDLEDNQKSMIEDLQTRLKLELDLRYNQIENYVECVPELTKKVQELEIKAEVLPAQVSKDIVTIFNEEYKKIVKLLKEGANII